MERQGFEKEATRLRPMLVRYAIRMVHDEDKAEDLVQDTLLKLWNIHDSLEQYRSVDALATAIIRNLSLNAIRDDHKADVDEEAMAQIADTSSFENDMMDAEETSEVMRLIGLLPDMQQTVLRMKHVEGLEIDEIAQMIGSKPDAVRQNLSRARKKIRDQFLNRKI